MRQMISNRHGGPYDRGSCDSYYGRGFRPHYYIGASYSTRRVEREQMTQEEVDEYTAGYRDNEEYGDKKDYG